ncbi:MAG TPA: hypothetical protein VNE38_01180 [Ktedonobacteraceae bacterium]|nr:hypothetical protein [Ktedonobacteraceae bacterium]
MAKTIADIEKKIDILDETEEAPKGRGWKFWVIAPIVLATVAGGAFLVVRRWLGSSEN